MTTEEASRGSWTSFLKSIASFSGDLSSLTAPPFILSPTSLTEFPVSYWCERPDYFAAIADAAPGQDRALATLKDQYTSRNEEMGSEKKPLNPVLGEVFYGSWPDKNGRGETQLLVEQVSHHPPITATSSRTRQETASRRPQRAEDLLLIWLHHRQQIGHAILTVGSGPSAEQYLITLPRLRIDGLWYGSPPATCWRRPCLHDRIQGQGLLFGQITYLQGDTHAVARMGGAGPRETVVEGTWHESSKFVKGGSGPFYEVVPVAWDTDIGEYETRRLIREGDFELASREKSRIENEQRQRRKDEAAEGTSWKLKHFVNLESDPIYEKYARSAKITPPTEDTYVFQENWPAAFASVNHQETK
ncbi:hypothetical protein BJ912DRAFT_977096 [Pholiota molesta]|nr:hypothetical protein BJ912DRAFT_977096 [Pholiota molesta]